MIYIHDRWSKAQFKFDFDELAFLAFSAAVTLTALGPVIHYVLIPFALLFLLIGAARNEAPLCVQLDRNSRCIVAVFAAFTLWTIIPNWFNVRDFMTWGEGASVFLEALIYMLIGARIFNTDARREKFAKSFVIFNAIICIDVTMRAFFPRDIIVLNHTLQTSNTMGNYALLVLPLLSCWAFWHQKSLLFRTALPVIVITTLIASYSSGYWATGAVTTVIVAYFAVAAHKLTWKLASAIIICTALCVSGLSTLSGGAENAKKLSQEVSQITSVHNTTKFTNHRNSIWFSAIYLAKKHPIAGQGRDTFAYQCERNFAEIEKAYGKKLFKGLERQTIHPHNMYLSVMYAAGIPALIMFIALLIMMLRRALRHAISEYRSDTTMPWGLAILLLLISQILAGMVGDIFEARRDIGVIFWACLGILLVLPTRNTHL